MKPLLAILNIFIDPPEAVKNMEGKFAWVPPVILASVAGIIAGTMMAPIALQVMRTNPPGNLSGEQLERALSMMETMSKAQIVVAPLMLIVMCALATLVLFGTCSVMDVKTTFGRLFTLVSHCWLVMVVAQVASLIVLKFKGEITSMRELQPSFGLDMFLPEGSSGVVVGMAKFFGLFNIWYFVVLVVGLATLLNVPKGKAFGVALPLIVLSFVFGVAGAMFSNR